MAHNLNFKANGVASFASRKEKAWHGLGTIVEAMNSAEAIELGGLNFHVEKRPIYINSSEHLLFEDAKKWRNINRVIDDSNPEEPKPIYRKNIIIPNQYATVRTDTDQPLGIVGERYHVIQNYEAFDFIDSIIGEGKADCETVGALGNGETIFITCKLREEYVINKDLIDKYLLITMSHDGSSSITVMFTPIRVVCNNTLSFALEAKDNKVTIRHTLKAKEKLEAAKKVLGIVDQQSLAYKEAFGRLYNIPVSDSKAKEVIEKSLKLPRDEKGQLSSKALNILNNADYYYQVGVGQENIVGTAWGVYNGIVGYLQNSKEYKNSEAMFKNTFITGIETRNRAIQQLLMLE